MILRTETDDMLFVLEHFKILILLGVRQCGKTTVAKQLISMLNKESVYLDLELPSDVTKLQNAELFFQMNKDKTIIVDEVQRMPELFPLIRALVDQADAKGRFILLGSSSLDLVQQSSESLAGRAYYKTLTPFLLNEIEAQNIENKHWLIGGFPEPFLAKQAKIRQYWFESYINTYIERDLRMLGLEANAYNLRMLFQMLASNQGQMLNYTALSRAIGVSGPTVKRYIHYFKNSFTLFLLPPWHQNAKKRLVKSPKTYLTDTGILHHLLNINSMVDLLGNIIAGYSWETYCILQILGNTNLTPYFYRTQDGAEIDLVLVKSDNQIEYAIEFKMRESPKLEKGNYIAFEDLKAKNNFVVTPTTSSTYPITENISVSGISNLIKTLSAEKVI